MNMQYRVGFIVDHPKRDLGGVIQVAHALSKQGVETCLIPLYDQGVDVPLLRLDALVINYARPINLDLVAGYVLQGIRVYVLDTEGGILSEEGANSIQGLADYIKGSPYTKLLSGYFFWGAILRDAFATKGIFDPEYLYLTGCPRFDIASLRWRDTLNYREDNYILVNANFPLVNPMFSRDVAEEGCILVRAGWDRDYVDKMIEDQREIQRGFLETVSQLAATFPERQFLVRPHPFEGVDIYKRRFSQFQNIKIDASGSVLNVLKNCACLLHLNCGTSIEAVMLDRLPISMEYLNTQHMAGHSTLPSQISLRAKSFDELVKLLENLPKAIEGFDFSGVYQSHIYGFFYKNDGAAGDRVAGHLLRRLSKTSYMNLWARLKWSLNSSRARGRPLQYLQALLANTIGSYAVGCLRSNLQATRQEKKIDIREVKHLFRSISEHDGISSPEIFRARHPILGTPLSSLIVHPKPLMINE
jgi:surface carbohydrate biosynthesis protein